MVVPDGSGHVPDELTTLLTQLVDTHLDQAAAGSRAAALRCCRDAVGFAVEEADAELGRDCGARAHRAAALLLALDCPDLPARVRRELAVGCGLTAVGAVARIRATD